MKTHFPLMCARSSFTFPRTLPERDGRSQRTRREREAAVALSLSLSVLCFWVLLRDNEKV